MATVSIEYYGVDGSGRNVTEAKRDAGRKIEQAMRGSYDPIVLTAGDSVVVVFRHPVYGWMYGFQHETAHGLSGIQGTDQDRAIVERAARKHLASNVTDWRECFSADDVHPVCMNDADRREIASNCRWQRQYRAAVDAGLDDHNARSLIGGFTQFMNQPVPAALDLQSVA